MEQHRVCALAWSTLTALLAVSVLSGLAYGADAPDLSGIYWTTQYNAKIQIVGGGELPFTAAGKAAYDKNIAGLKDGSITDNARKFCVPDGLPRVLANPYPFEIIQAPPGQITIIYELSHQVRMIALEMTDRMAVKERQDEQVLFIGQRLVHGDHAHLMAELINDRDLPGGAWMISNG